MLESKPIANHIRQLCGIGWRSNPSPWEQSKHPVTEQHIPKALSWYIFITISHKAEQAEVNSLNSLALATLPSP